jgi:hypothetical protein
MKSIRVPSDKFMFVGVLIGQSRWYHKNAERIHVNPQKITRTDRLIARMPVMQETTTAT